jgi:hypothetical protein
MSDKETANLVMETVEIKRYMRADGSEIISLEAIDALGEPLGLVEAMNLLEYSKLQLTIEMVRQTLADEDEYEEED